MSRPCTLWLLFATACHAGAQAPDGGPPIDGPAGGQLDIVSLTRTTPTITGGAPDSTETDRETFVAIVTDTAGLDDIAGGELLDDAGRTYAAFGADATKGTYTATIEFMQINQIDPVAFTTTGSRTFVAKFFANGGAATTSALDIMLACRTGDGLVGACAGACTDLAVGAQTCGACDHACLAGQLCANSTCGDPVIVGGFTACTDARASIAGATCNDVCAAAHQTCDPQNSLDGLFGYTACDAVPSPAKLCAQPIGAVGTSFFRCGCTS